MIFQAFRELITQGIISEEEMDQLFILKRADILAQNEKMIMDRLDNLEKQKNLYYITLDEINNNQFIKKGGNDYNE